MFCDCEGKVRVLTLHITRTEVDTTSDGSVLQGLTLTGHSQCYSASTPLRDSRTGGGISSHIQDKVVASDTWSILRRSACLTLSKPVPAFCALLQQAIPINISGRQMHQLTKNQKSKCRQASPEAHDQVASSCSAMASCIHQYLPTVLCQHRKSPLKCQEIQETVLLQDNPPTSNYWATGTVYLGMR